MRFTLYLGFRGLRVGRHPVRALGFRAWTRFGV